MEIGLEFVTTLSCTHGHTIIHAVSRVVYSRPLVYRMSLRRVYINKQEAEFIKEGLKWVGQAKG